MNHFTTPATQHKTNKNLRIFLWIAQLMLCATFIMSAFMKLTTPISQLSATMPWTGELPEAFVRFIGLVDLAGGLGILLPALTRIQPRLGVLAAAGIILLQILAIGFHSLRGEWMVLPLNFVLLPLAIFVLWGRSRREIISSR